MTTTLRLAQSATPNAQTIAQLEQYTFEELQKLFVLVDLLVQGYHEVSYREPAKKEDGMIVYADGTKWNPGAGKGYYYLKATVWTLIA